MGVIVTECGRFQPAICYGMPGLIIIQAKCYTRSTHARLFLLIFQKVALHFTMNPVVTSTRFVIQYQHTSHPTSSPSQPETKPPKKGEKTCFVPCDDLHATSRLALHMRGARLMHACEVGSVLTAPAGPPTTGGASASSSMMLIRGPCWSLMRMLARCCSYEHEDTVDGCLA